MEIIPKTTKHLALCWDSLCWDSAKTNTYCGFIGHISAKWKQSAKWQGFLENKIYQ